MITTETLFLNQDNLIVVKEMVSSITNEFITIGTVTARVEDKLGVVLGGPINLSYSGADGIWMGVMPQIASTAGTRCFLVVTAQSGDGYGLYGFWKEPAIFDVRNSNAL